jgi:thiamine kinase-like enzyme
MSGVNTIVARLQGQLGPASGPPVPLDGGITNRNYRVRFGGRDYVVRLPGKDTSLLGISRDAERIANAAAARLGTAPEVAAADESCLVTSFIVCEPVDGARLREAPEPVAAALRAFHDSGTQLPVRFWVPELLDDYAAIVDERGGSLPESYGPTQALARRIAAALPLNTPVPCHDDLLPANLLSVDPGAGASATLMLVDWEYAGMGHRMFDLGNLAVNNEFDEAAEERLLAAYFGEPPSPGHRAALCLMRIMSDAREAAWGVVQSAISELDFDFRAYAERHFSRLAEAAGDPRLQEWLDAASA